MPERDAFGNELPAGDASPGSDEPEASAAFGAPVGPEEHRDVGSAPVDRGPATAPREAPAPRRPRVRTEPGLTVVPRVVGGCISFVAIVFVVGGCAIAGLVGSIGEGVDTFRSFSTELSRTTPAPPEDAPATAPTPAPTTGPRGLQRGSLLRRAAFSRAVTKLRGSGLGRPRSLRVAPDRIDTQLVTRTGRLRSVQIGIGGALRTLSTTSAGGFPGRNLVSLSAVDRGAPERLARAAARRSRLPSARIDYLVLAEVGGVPRWLVFFENGPAYQADRTGRIERSLR